MKEFEESMGGVSEEYKTLDINNKTFQDDLFAEIEAVKQAANEYYNMGNAVGYAKTMSQGLANIRQQIIESAGGNELTKYAKDMQTATLKTQTLMDVTEEWRLSLEHAFEVAAEEKGVRGGGFGFKWAALKEEWEKLVADFRENAEIAKADMQQILTELFVDLDMPGLDGIAKDLFKLDVDHAAERKKIEDELKEIMALIEGFEELIASPTKIIETIKSELAGIKEKYKDERKTKVIKVNMA
jgi:hypothetical protein